MADNVSKISRLHDLLPKHLNSKQNVNWSGLISAIGSVDQETADLISEVRRQFFVKTASRPYLDRLAANNKISRPKLVGMDDQSFRDYIPVLSYKPKQVKLIIDRLLDIFFFKESTTAFITSQAAAPFELENNWEFEYVVDENNTERVGFKSSEFTDISKASTAEIVSAINRQTKYSYATTYFDSVTKKSYIRLFSNTIGSKGSIRILGGRANIALRFNGFIDEAGNGEDTVWQVTKIGDLATFKHLGGSYPGISALNEGDIAIVNLSGNVGSFRIRSVDVAAGEMSFVNLFATPGTFTQTSSRDIKFIKSNKYVAYTNPRRAMTWETSPGEMVVEMPTSPPVVKRSLKGSFHLNGTFSLMVNRDSDSSITVEDASSFPKSGSFYLEKTEEILTKISEELVVSRTQDSRNNGERVKYDYLSREECVALGDVDIGSTKINNLTLTTGIAAGQSVFGDGIERGTTVVAVNEDSVTLSKPTTKSLIKSEFSFCGNTLYNVSPPLPAPASLNERNLLTLKRQFNEVECQTDGVHGYKVGENIIVSGAPEMEHSINGSYTITEIQGDSALKFKNFGPNTDTLIAESAKVRVERAGLANSGSKVVLVGALSQERTGIRGSYAWDLAAPFVLSSSKAKTLGSIPAGKVVRLLEVSSNSIPDSGGFVIFNYGKSSQEGPVRYLYKPTSTTLAIDPSYVFQKSHSTDSTVTYISTKGPHRMGGSASEYPPYITDPSEARVILQELIKSVKSAGIFVNFLVRYPEQLYATLDVYNKQGLGAGAAFNV